MDVKEAVHLARKYFAEIFMDEAARATLEEVWFDDRQKHWCITLGLRRAPQYNLGGLVAGIDYKTVRLQDADGHLISIRNRQADAA